MKLAFALPAALALAAILPSQSSKTIGVEYTDGRTARVQVLELDGKKVRLKVLVLGGSMDVIRKLSDFTPESAFVIEVVATQPKSYDEHFSLAKKAGELRLVTEAGGQARAAVHAAGSDQAKVDAVRVWAADTLEAALKEAVAANNLPDADHYLQLLASRFSAQRTETQLDALAASVDQLKVAKRRDQAAARQARMDAKTKEAVEKRLKPIYANIEKGKKLQHEALTKSGNTSESARLSSRAIDHYKAAWKAAQALGKKYPKDESLSQEIESIGERLHDDGIRAALHAANVLTVQSDYKGAMSWTSKVLAFDPDNADAKRMVETIQMAAAASSDRWGWGRPVRPIRSR